MTVAVVGGGLAGITAALSLADRGVRVVMLESRPSLGGATYSFRRRGYWVDNGQHVFLRCCTSYRWLIRRLGVESDVHLQPRLTVAVVEPGGRTAWLRRNALPAPLHVGAALARYGHLSVSERLRAVRAALALRALDPSEECLDRESFGSWLRRHGQSPRAVEALWGLISVPTTNVDPDHTSLQVAAKVFRTGLLERRDAADIGYPTVPLQALHGEAATRALAGAGVDVRLTSPVRSVAITDGRFTVSGSDWTLGCEAVVAAVPHDDAARLLSNTVASEAGGLGWSPIVNVHVHYDRKVMTLPFLAGVGTPVQWLFDRTAASGVTEGQYLAVSLSAADAYVDRSSDELRATFLPAIEALLPRARAARVLDLFVTRSRRATFRATPGSGAHRPPARTTIPGLALAGAWTDTGWPATMEGAVRSGVAAAREVLVALGRTRGLPEVDAALASAEHEPDPAPVGGRV